jgi:hypothetical protein
MHLCQQSLRETPHLISRGSVQQLLLSVDRHGKVNRCIFMTFHFENTKNMHDLCNEIQYHMFMYAGMKYCTDVKIVRTNNKIQTITSQNY